MPNGLNIILEYQRKFIYSALAYRQVNTIILHFILTFNFIFMKKSEIIIPGVKFVKHDLENGPAKFTLQELIDKYKIKHNSGIDNLLGGGGYKLLGYYYNIKPYIKKYIVKQYGHLQEYYAPNKTLLRIHLYGKIDYIKEF